MIEELGWRLAMAAACHRVISLCCEEIVTWSSRPMIANLNQRFAIRITWSGKIGDSGRGRRHHDDDNRTMSKRGMWSCFPSGRRSARADFPVPTLSHEASLRIGECGRLGMDGIVGPPRLGDGRLGFRSVSNSGTSGQYQLCSRLVSNRARPRMALAFESSEGLVGAFALDGMCKYSHDLTTLIRDWAPRTVESC